MGVSPGRTEPQYRLREGAPPRLAPVTTIRQRKDAVFTDPLELLAAAFRAGHLAGDDYLRHVEDEVAETMPVSG